MVDKKLQELNQGKSPGPDGLQANGVDSYRQNFHMKRNNLFSQMQHGFVPLKNCMTNLLLCMGNWTNKLKGYPMLSTQILQKDLIEFPIDDCCKR